MPNRAQARERLVELLAALSHEQWAGWYAWQRDHTGGIHASGEPFDRRWWRQARTPYELLSPEERESDRVEARKVVELLEANQLLVAQALRVDLPALINQPAPGPGPEPVTFEDDGRRHWLEPPRTLPERSGGYAEVLTVTPSDDPDARGEG